jgi:hypothetical protein
MRIQVEKCIVLVAAATALPGVSQADFVDHFLIGSGQYTAGINNLYGQNPPVTGWTGAWADGFAGAESPDVVSSGLSYTNGSGTMSGAGGAVVFSAPGSDAGRGGRNLSSAFTNSTNETVYFSFMMESNITGGDVSYSALELHSGGFDDGAHRKLQIGVGENVGSGQSNNYFVRLFNNNDSGFAADLGPNAGDVNFFVAKVELSSVNDGDSLTLWRNPEDLTSEANSTIDFSKSGFNLEFDRTSLARFGTSGGAVVFDELRFGSSFQAVAIPEASAILAVPVALIAAGLGGQVARRCRRASAAA